MSTIKVGLKDKTLNVEKLLQTQAGRVELIKHADEFTSTLFGKAKDFDFTTVDINTDSIDVRFWTVSKKDESKGYVYHNSYNEEGDLEYSENYVDVVDDPVKG